jgi:hypothetical protein
MNFQSRADYIQAYVNAIYGRDVASGQPRPDLTPIARLRLKMTFNEWDVRRQAAEDWETMFEDEPTERT